VSEGSLDLSSLTSLSHAAAEAILIVLELAEQNVIDDPEMQEEMDYQNNAIEQVSIFRDSLSKHEGVFLHDLGKVREISVEGDLNLDGLTSLSDAAAESLSKHEGSLSMDLDELPESVADILRSHPSFAEDEEDEEDDDKEDDED
jgi:hypothetical protein